MAVHSTREFGEANKLHLLRPMHYDGYYWSSRLNIGKIKSILMQASLASKTRGWPSCITLGDPARATPAKKIRVART